MKKYILCLLIICMFNMVFAFATDAVLLINNDESETRTPNVELIINYPNAFRMRFANDRMDNWSEWESYSKTKSWALSTGDGTKVVYIEIEDKSGNTSIYSDKIVLEKYPRGSITLRWEYVHASVGGYAIYLWDGYMYREIDRVHQDVLEWNSDEAKIYPDEDLLRSFDDHSVTQSLFTAKGKGKRLRNNPNSLYRVMKEGTEHSYEECKDHYFFKIATINGVGERAFSEPISTRMDNWEEAYNMPPEVSITINNGDSETTVSKVELKIVIKDDTSAEDSIKIRLANDKEKNFKKDWKSLSDYSNLSYDDKNKEWTLIIKDWELSSEFGEKAVFVEVNDKDAESTVASDKIIFKELVIGEIELSTQNGAHATLNMNVVLKIKDEDIDDFGEYICSYEIDGEVNNVDINNQGEIEVELINKNKNRILVTLKSKDGKKIRSGETILWRLEQ